MNLYNRTFKNTTFFLSFFYPLLHPYNHTFTHTTIPSKIQPYLQIHNHTFKNRLSIHRQKISTMFCNVSGPFPKMVTLPLLTFTVSGKKNYDEKVHSTVGYNRERQRRCHNVQGRKPNHLSKYFIDFPQLTAFQ